MHAKEAARNADSTVSGVQELTSVYLEEAVSHLATQPGMGRPGRVDGTREFVVAGTPYIIPYRVRGETVELLAVMHGARRWPDTFGL